MKKVIKYIFVLWAVMFVYTSCEKVEEVSTPTISKFEATPTTAAVGETVTFNIQTDAYRVVIWPGQPGDPDDPQSKGNDYYLRQQQGKSYDGSEKNLVRTFETGLTVKDTFFTSTYTKAGVFKAVLVATNIGDFGNDVKQAMDEIEITILEE